jgi:hypothetical protein
MTLALASLGMQGAPQLQLKAAPCKLRVLSFLAREIIAVRLRKHARSSPPAAPQSQAAAAAAADSAPMPLTFAALAPQLALAAQALSSRLACAAPVAPVAPDAAAQAAALLRECVKLVKQLPLGGGCAALLVQPAQKQQQEQIDEVSRVMRGEYVHRRALLACRIKATEEAFACSDAAAKEEDVVPSLRRQGERALAMLSRDSVPLFTWRTLQVHV